MNAQEAAQKTSKNLHETAPQEQYKIIMNVIDYNAKCGRYSVWRDYLYKEVIQKLRSEGYKVKYHFFGGGYTISWKPLKNNNYDI